MSNFEIVNHFKKAIRVFGMEKLPRFSVVSGSKVYKCIPTPGTEYFVVKGYRGMREVDTIGTILLSQI